MLLFDSTSGSSILHVLSEKERESERSVRIAATTTKQVCFTYRRLHYELE